MQVICNQEKECRYRDCVDPEHFKAHYKVANCEKRCLHNNCSCVPVQSDFERGQEELRKIFSEPCPYQTTWWFNRKRTLEFAGDSLFDNRGVVWQFDSTSEPMPGGICRRCGHPVYYHWNIHNPTLIINRECHLAKEFQLDCDCKEFVLAEPLAPAQEQQPTSSFSHRCGVCGGEMSKNPHPQAGNPEHYVEVGTIYVCIPCTYKGRHQWAERATKAEAALGETYTAVRNGGRREVVELIKRHSLQVKLWDRIWTTILTSELEDAEKEWGL